MAEAKLTKLQENRYTTFIDIDTVFERNSSIVSRIPQLADSVANFRSIISDISNKAVIRNTILKGTSLTKTVKRLELEAVIIEVSSALFALGHKTSNEIIKAIGNVTPSLLDRMRDTEVINKANSILNTATENEAALEPFGLTAGDLSRLRSCISNYMASSTEKSGSKTESVVITKTLKELFQNGMDILDKEIDKIVNSLQTKEKNFYDSYYAVRSVKNLGIRKKKVTEEEPKQLTVNS